MIVSNRFSQLISRIYELESSLLPIENPTGNYTVHEMDMLKGYLLLVHAEIEAYFEDVVKKKVNDALDAWSQHGRKSSCLKAILAFPGNELNYENVNPEKFHDMQYRMNRAVAHYFKKVNSNNGVKSENLINMLIPIGVEKEKLDDIWLATMDSFGLTRGNIAHNSHLGVNVVLDRNSIKDQIKNQIIPEIRKIDVLIKNIK